MRNGENTRKDETRFLIRKLELVGLAYKLGVSTSTLYRWKTGKPINKFLIDRFDKLYSKEKI